MRNLAVVIDEMIKIIPEDQTELVSELNTVKGRCVYMSPEMQTHEFKNVARLLFRFFGTDPEGWRVDVLRVWNPNYDEDIRKGKVSAR